MSGWIPALRIARREAWRAKGRSLLVLVLIGVPVALLTALSAGYDTFTLTVQERLDRQMGTADALIQWDTTAEIAQSIDGSWWETVRERNDGSAPGGQAELLALLPPGTRLVPGADVRVKVGTPDGIAAVDARMVDALDPLARGIVSIVEGTAASRPDEVSLNAAAAQWLGAKVGDKVTLYDPDRSVTVVSIVEYPSDLEAMLFFGSSAQEMLNIPSDGIRWLADTPAPVTWADIKQLNKNGVVATSRSVLLNPPGRQEVGEAWQLGEREVNVDQLSFGVIVAGLGILEIIMLAGPAFAIGARRRSRDLALVAAAGGTPGQLRRIVLADGFVLGAAATVAGLVIGAAVAVAATPFVEDFLVHRRAGEPRFFPLALLTIAGFAIGTGVLAALVPAFTAARQDVVRALAGRRGIVRSRKRWVVVGAALIALGATVAMLGSYRFNEIVILAGIIPGEIGLLLITPALLGLIARIGRWLPVAPRLALRDAARNRTTAAPAVAAIMVAIAGAVASGIFLGGSQRANVESYSPSLPMGRVGVVNYSGDADAEPPDWNEVGSALRAVLPGAQVEQFRALACPPGSVNMLACGLSPVIPQEQRCLGLELGSSMFDLASVLTEEQKRAAERDPRCRVDLSSGFRGDVVDDGTAIPALTGAPAAEVAKAREVLSRGGVVVTDPRYLKDGKVTLLIYADGYKLPSTAGKGGEGYVLSEVSAFAGGQMRQVPAITVEGYLLSGGVPSVELFISPLIAGWVGFTVTDAGMVAAPPGMPSQANEERLNLLTQAIHGGLYVSVERGPDTSPDPLSVGVAVAAALIALCAAAIATALMAAESRADLGTLAAVGAAPAARRRLTLSQAGVISGLGAVLGTVIGLGTAAALIFALNQIRAQDWPPPQTQIPVTMPWDTLLIILTVPLMAMVAAGLLTRSRLPIERRL